MYFIVAFRLIVEQDDSGEYLNKTIIFLKRCDSTLMEIDLSNQISGFSPMLFIYMNNISEIDISGCTSLPLIDFMDCIVFCKKLKVLNMIACKQFSELHLLQFLPELDSLISLNLEECQELSFPVAYWIISSLQNLRLIDFIPRRAATEYSDWKRLFEIFFQVQFGVSFKRLFPYFWGYVRLPRGYEEE